MPEAWERLQRRLGVSSREEVLRALGIDCRVVSYDSFCRDPDDPGDGTAGGAWRRTEPDGTERDIWGARRRKVANAFGVLEQFASYPLASAESIDDLRRHRWPRPDWWNFDGLRAAIEKLDAGMGLSIRYRVGSVFETAWSLVGFERFLVELAGRPEIPSHVMERIAEVHVENLRRALEAAGDLIDIVYFYDDLATQGGLLMSPRMYDAAVRPFHRRIIDLASRHGKPVMMHCCGAIAPMIPRLIDMGLSVLSPIQPRARGMAPEELARDFGGRIAFHGGIDIQELLPHGTAGEVRKRAVRTVEILGARGGYILAGSHHIQADTPVENILAMFEAV
jgi:uroporphyrinogen decarboxylase